MSGEGKSPFGWRLFGVVAPGRLDHPSVEMLVDQKYDWPPAEVHNGVAGFRVDVWADDPAGAYLRVWGPDRDAVEVTFDSLAAAVRAGALADHFPTEASS